MTTYPYLHFHKHFLTYRFKWFAVIWSSTFLTDMYATARSLFRRVRNRFARCDAEKDRITCDCKSEFYQNENPHVWPSVRIFPPSSRLSGSVFRQQASRQSWLCGKMTSPACHTAAERGKLCALHSQQQISGEFICSHMNSKSAFNTSKLQRGFCFVGNA